MQHMTSGLVWSGLVWVAVCTPSVRAQTPQPGDLHPHVGDEAPGAIRNTVAADPNNAWPEHPDESPLMNFGDGVWNQGEAADALDLGGFRAWVDAPLQLDVHVHRYVRSGQSTPEGWVRHDIPVTPGGALVPFWRLRGHFGPQPVIGDIEDGAFEIAAPHHFDPSKRTVVVLDNWSTNRAGVFEPVSGNAPDIGVWGAPAWGSRPGLWGRGFQPDVPDPDNWSASIGLLKANELRRQQGTMEYNVIAVQPMPRMVPRAPRFYMQRSIELVKAVNLMLADVPGPPGTDSPWRPPGHELVDDGQGGQAVELTYWAEPILDPTIVFAGGSLGGIQAMWSALLFPDLVHGAWSSGASPSFRDVLAENQFGQALAALSGFGDNYNQIGRRELLHYRSL
ncbi:MAG: hypothetical protein AB7O97_24280, partial [Planctomycetota bacterium]